MTGQEAIDFIGLDRAKSVKSKSENLLEDESIVIKDILEKEFEVDSVYFNVDESGKSFPAVFLKKVESFNEKNSHAIAEVHRKIWNYKKVLFLYVYSDIEIRIYNCSEKPFIPIKEDFNISKEIQRMEVGKYFFSDIEQLDELNKLFSRIAIDSGIIWTLKEAHFIRDKIDLQKRVDKYLVSSLVNTANQLEQQGLKKDFIHKIILRSLFLLFLEDRKATEEQFYSKIKNGAKSYFDILDDTKATYKLYKRLDEDFNGNVFTVEDYEEISKDQLNLIKKCFISGNDNTPQTKLFENWRLFNFNIIQIELLSEIYEKFLSETDKSLKEDSGAYYTPPTLVEFILNEKLPTRKADNEYNIKILDPSCGSGIFLVESFKRLVKRYENRHNKELKDFEKLKELLTDNIFGIELHPQAIKVAAFSLYLALVDNLDPKTLWQKKKHQLPYLINDPAEKNPHKQGYNLFCRDTIEKNKEIEDIEFDLVVGNPPFGTKNILSSIRKYCDNEGFAKEKVLPFLHKATKFSSRGDIALIFNTKVLTNSGGTYQNFRKWLFNECYVEKIYNFSILRKAKKNFGGQLFGDATGPISIVFYRKEQPKNPSEKIAYYAPKTFIKSNIVDGLSVDFTDIKYLPREECQKPDTKIWKIAMWGGLKDWELMNNLLKKENNIKDYLRVNKIKYSVGLQPLNRSTKKPIKDNEISKLKFIRPEKIERFYTDKSKFSNINSLLKNKETINTYLNYYDVDSVKKLPTINSFRRITGKELFFKHKLLAKEGFKNNQLCFSFVDNSVAYNSSVLGFSVADKNKLRVLSCLLNSKLATYFLLLFSNSWGIERERIKPNEIYNFPVVIEKKEQEELTLLHREIENKISTSILNVDYTLIENKINELIFNLYSLEGNTKQLIEDFIKYSVDLFHKQENSVALNPVPQRQAIEYGEIISSEINSFLDGQGLFANVTIYEIDRFTPLMMIKLSFEVIFKEISIYSESVDEQLKKLDHQLWEEKSTSIYFRKKLNYKTGNDIFIIRPNQRRFWSKSMALEDASELILEILNEN